MQKKSRIFLSGKPVKGSLTLPCYMYISPKPMSCFMFGNLSLEGHVQLNALAVDASLLKT